MDSETKITYGGKFAIPVATAGAAPSNSETKYVGADVMTWTPKVEKSTKDALSEASTR